MATFFKTGDLITIIDAQHSWATDTMFGMIGETHKIDMALKNNSYRIGTYIWSWKDLKKVKSPQPIIKPDKFDPDELW
jgi:hypothetical protein